MDRKSSKAPPRPVLAPEVLIRLGQIRELDGLAGPEQLHAKELFLQRGTQRDVAEQDHLGEQARMVGEIRAGGFAALAGIDPFLMMARRAVQTLRGRAACLLSGS